MVNYEHIFGLGKIDFLAISLYCNDFSVPNTK